MKKLVSTAFWLAMLAAPLDVFGQNWVAIEPFTPRFTRSQFSGPLDDRHKDTGLSFGVSAARGDGDFMGTFDARADFIGQAAFRNKKLNPNVRLVEFYLGLGKGYETNKAGDDDNKIGLGYFLMAGGGLRNIPRAFRDKNHIQFQGGGGIVFGFPFGDLRAEALYGPVWNGTDDAKGWSDGNALSFGGRLVVKFLTVGLNWTRYAIKADESISPKYQQNVFEIRTGIALRRLF